MLHLMRSRVYCGATPLIFDAREAAFILEHGCTRHMHEARLKREAEWHAEYLGTGRMRRAASAHQEI